MEYFIEINSNKAKNDVNEIVKSIGYCNLAYSSQRSDMLSRFWTKVSGVINILFCLHKGDILFLQYPMKKFYQVACIFAHFKKAKVVTLVHDLGAFRRHKLTPQKENKILSNSDFTIVHNEHMMKWLQNYGFKKKLYTLEIFDYLSPSIPASYPTPHNPFSVVYAGGLGPWRNAFLYELDPHIHNWSLEIYGKGFDPKLAEDWKHINYHGCLSPDELLATAEGDYGLVWDGDTINGCSGNWGEYLRVNNPHKTSFCLRCGLPVIIWEQAALASFIKKHKIGFCVESLADIDKAIKLISQEEYECMRKNAKIFGNKLANGHFTKKALEAAKKHFNTLQK